MEPINTKSYKWRLWHSGIYLVGGITFFVGSIILYDYFQSKFDNALISAWLYVIGCTSFLIADLAEWWHYEKSVIRKQQMKMCENRSISINLFASAFGTAIYLTGSIMFIPAVNQQSNGLYAFIVGSDVIALSQAWKISRVLFEQNGLGICGNLKKDLTGFLTDFSTMIGALLYLIGSIFYLDTNQSILLAGTTLYAIGGSLFYISSLLVIKGYFFNNKKQSSHQKMIEQPLDN